MNYKVAKSFAPAGISSFFEICDKTNNENSIKNLDGYNFQWAWASAAACARGMAQAAAR